MRDLTGMSHNFPDGARIEVAQIKQREDGPWVHYYISMGSGLPRKLLMKYSEFMDNYKHLFGEPDE
jgi:hypothetical protein